MITYIRQPYFYLNNNFPKRYLSDKIRTVDVTRTFQWIRKGSDTKELTLDPYYYHGYVGSTNVHISFLSTFRVGDDNYDHNDNCNDIDY